MTEFQTETLPDVDIAATWPAVDDHDVLWWRREWPILPGIVVVSDLRGIGLNMVA